MTHTTRKTRFLLCVLAALVLAALLFLGGVLRPDWVFRLKEGIRCMTAENPLEPFKPVAVTDYTPDTSSYGSEALMLVSEAYPMPDGYLPNVMEYRGTGLWMQSAVAEAYAELAAAVLEETGQKLLIRDAYRTQEEQAGLYDADPGITALPGTSEHEVGLALDVYISRFAGYGFLKSKAGRFVGRRCSEYGFIIRYPDGGKERLTGIPYEPWHLRYVGAPHAELITRAGFCFEEYLDFLAGGEFWRWGDWVISRQPEGACYRLPAGAEEISISPDNTGCVILTCRLVECNPT